MWPGITSDTNEVDDIDDNQLPEGEGERLAAPDGQGADMDETGGVPAGIDGFERDLHLDASRAEITIEGRTSERVETTDTDERLGEVEENDTPVRPLVEMSEVRLAQVARELFDRVFGEAWQTRAVADRPSLEEQLEGVVQFIGVRQVLAGCWSVCCVRDR